ncbi:MAG: hypothetical protein WB424_00775 [Terracidiphilus sp.]
MQQEHRFFVGSIAVLCLAGALTMTAIAQEEKSPDLAQAISKVRENVATLHKKLPDFVCQEEVTVRQTENSKTTEKKHYLLSLRAVRQPQGAASQFSESRDVLSATVDGKAVKESRFDPPVHFLRGGLAQDLFTFFDEPTSSCFEFKLASTPGATESNSLVLDATLNKNLRPLPAECAHMPEGLQAARVWIDLKAMQVVRIRERTGTTREFSIPFAHSNGEFTSSPVIEYAPVSIHGSEYWLPRSKSVVAIKTKGQFSISYTSQYSDYHKFETTAIITAMSESDEDAK